MEQPVNLLDIDSVEKLESMAYRQTVVIDQARQNLAAIQQRISQLQPKAEPTSKVD